MEVRLPRLGEGADSGTVSTVFVKEGDLVRKDQPVLELESEKAVASIPSPAAGKITKMYVREGDTIKVGQLILALSENGGSLAPTEQSKAIDASVGDDEEPGSVVVEEEEAIHTAEEAEPSGPAAVRKTVPGIAPPASPSVRKIARELGIDLTRVRGSERGGRIILADIKRYVQRLQQAPPQPRRPAPGSAQDEARPAAEPVDFSRWGKVSPKKMSTLRRTISTKMVESWTTIPHITQFDEADITRLLALLKKYAPKYEKNRGHLTLTSFAMRAVVETLKKHPLFRASINEATGEIIVKEYFHIGIAVDTDHGLIVPVLRDADRKSLLQISKEVRELAQRTRDRKVGLDEMQGGSFTISNQGGIGSGFFTPIINKPEDAILGMGRGVTKPVVRKGKVVQRTMLPLGLSYDHRVIDGADAARFMVDLVVAFESFKESDVKI